MENLDSRVGMVYGRLTVVEDVGELDHSKRPLLTVSCVCGEIFKRRIDHVLRGNGACKLCSIKTRAENSRKYESHSRGDSLYSVWMSIKARCLNKKHLHYEQYGGRGINLHEDWVNNFIMFKDYVGDPPSDGKKYSLDRIDNDVGYVPDNIRWATWDQQARNRRANSRNTTGVNGVYWRFVLSNDRKTLLKYSLAKWSKLKGKSCGTKQFSVNKYGEELAFFMACEYREQMINLLNLQGAGYSEKHGR